MSRVTTALMRILPAICIIYIGAGVAVAEERLQHAEMLLARIDTQDTGKETGTLTGAKKASEKQVREPARQVPVEPFDEPAEALTETKSEKPLMKAPEDKGNSPSAGEAGITVPGLPKKKPRKPVLRRESETKKADKRPATSKSARDLIQCKALRKCRNEFVKCKSRIKFPDQSEPWSAAKEVCGGYYKTCIEKNFQGGEWFLTRWFYFGELKCGK